MAEHRDLVDVVVEIPRGSRNKYEYDHEPHVMRRDRRLFSATVYRAEYGFIPETLPRMATRWTPGDHRGPDLPWRVSPGLAGGRVLDT